MTLDYISGGTCIRHLNNVLPADWSFEIISVTQVKREVIVHGRLRVWVDGECRVHEQFGSGEFVSDKTSAGDVHKTAATDALKKCATHVGVALDLYHPDIELLCGGGESVTDSVGSKEGVGDSGVSDKPVKRESQQVDSELVQRIKDMYDMLVEKTGTDDKQSIIALVSAIIGRNINSAKQLSIDDVNTVYTNINEFVQDDADIADERTHE